MKFHEISWHEISVQDFVPSIIGTHGLRGDRPPADCREGGERILFAVHQRWQYTTVSDSVRIEMPRQREGKGPLRRKGDGCDSASAVASRAHRLGNGALARLSRSCRECASRPPSILVPLCPTEWSTWE
jgi:hypothetical protein